MIDRIVPMVQGLLEMAGCCLAVASAVARMIPKIVNIANVLKDEGADIEKELDLMLDNSELAVRVEESVRFRREEPTKP